MKITLAQTQSKKGNIDTNIEHHIHCIEYAEGSDLIIFPELSITNYEPELAKELAFEIDDPRLTIFQNLAIKQHQIIGISLPIKTKSKPRIGLLFFHPTKPKQLYEKQYLHADEVPFFDPGTQQVYLNEALNIAPAICYEVSVEAHAKAAFQHPTDIYFASVAKTQTGVQNAHAQLREISEQHSCVAMMVNAVGPADNFINAGQSGIWNNGSKIIDANQYFEQLITFDTISLNTTVMNIPS
ncbi:MULTISPECIES: carbon-nitrogen hydrolase family protein [unclassified Paraflavitalea]|uniref:carbon-nitrogen hydrolase family protein n=1 Tax=unclassified Paraflavitalea TaxID=2798305 RepID=UPI003D34AF1F